MNQTNRHYRATFILDNRGKEETTDTIIESVKQEISAVHGEVTGVENLGKRDFVRITDRKFPAGNYVQISFSAPPDGPAQLREKLRLNHNVYRTFVESV
jgi:small subunit ribosomal protein S6